MVDERYDVDRYPAPILARIGPHQFLDDAVNSMLAVQPQPDGRPQGVKLRDTVQSKGDYRVPLAVQFPDLAEPTRLALQNLQFSPRVEPLSTYSFAPY